MRIALVASESNPLCKTGGLADVIYSLAKQLVVMGEEAIVVLPLYKAISDNPHIKVRRLGSFPVYMSWRKQEAIVYRCYIDGICFYLIGNDYYFQRENLYGYGDDDERFAFFTLASRNLFSFVSFSPEIIHIHDWQAGMLPVLIKEQSMNDPIFKGTKMVLTIHNPEFQGMTNPDKLSEFYGLPYSLFENGSLRFNGMLSTLKAGIIYSDKITTVSPTHRGELLSLEGSKGLSSVMELRKDDFVGILNGIDYGEWNPLEDSYIDFNFGADNFKEGKLICRKSLLKSCFLRDDNEPLYGMVCRLTHQKGVELVISEMPRLLSMGAKLIVLGSGEKELEDGLRDLQARYPENCVVYIGYNNALAHSIYAGSDFFLMPSLFEPCGIGQMIAHRYGSLPIARDTGGLHDSIISYSEKKLDKANGFLFKDYSSSSFSRALSRSFDVYHVPSKMDQMTLNAIEADHSWDTSAKKYMELFHSLLEKKPL